MSHGPRSLLRALESPWSRQNAAKVALAGSPMFGEMGVVPSEDCGLHVVTLWSLGESRACLRGWFEV